MNPSKSSKLVRCKKCFRLLCKRVPIVVEHEETYIVHIKHRGIELYTFDATITCPACHTKSRINGDQGILAVEINHYAESQS